MNFSSAFKYGYLQQKGLPSGRPFLLEFDCIYKDIYDSLFLFFAIYCILWGLDEHPEKLLVTRLLVSPGVPFHGSTR